MSGSAALASAKRRRSGMDMPTVIQEENRVMEGNEKETLQLTQVEAINLHEQKLGQLYNFHLEDKKRIGDLEELVKELYDNSSVDEMGKLDIRVNNTNMSHDEELEKMENRLNELSLRLDEIINNKIVEKTTVATSTTGTKRGLKEPKARGKKIEKEVILDEVVRSDLTTDLEMPTFPQGEVSMTDNIIFDENEETKNIKLVNNK